MSGSRSGVDGTAVGCGCLAEVQSLVLTLGFGLMNAGSHGTKPRRGRACIPSGMRAAPFSWAWWRLQSWSLAAGLPEVAAAEVAVEAAAAEVVAAADVVADEDHCTVPLVMNIEETAHVLKPMKGGHLIVRPHKA